MTVQQLVNGVVYAGTVAGALSGIGVFLHFAVVRPVRGFLRREIVANLVEIKAALDGNADTLEGLGRRLDDHIINGGHLTGGTR